MKANGAKTEKFKETKSKHILKLYNTLGRQVTAFVPLDTAGKTVGMYTCGPTVYNYAHIGNLRTYVFEDILKRTLLYNGFSVKHVMNITDVGHLTDDADSGEDKVERSAAREGKTAWELAEKYTKAFQDDIHKLNILDPDVWCKATTHIPEQIAWIQKLEEKGFTYRLSDGIYYDTSKFSSYGELAHLDIEHLQAGARIEMVEGKRNPTDFALWKFSPTDKKRQMEWDSPWGKGFPGWHIECSAMSSKYLGEQFDIHCGGIDHIPVHHTNEIAQVEAITGKPWVKYWLHGEFLLIQKKTENKEAEEIQRMGKSHGNFLTLQVLEERGFAPLAYRYLLLTAHYRKQLVFSDDAMESAKRGFANLKDKIVALKKQAEHPLEVVRPKRTVTMAKNKYRQEFLTAINDDLNMPKALALVWKILDDRELPVSVSLEILLDFDHVLGFNMAAMAEEPAGEIPKHIQELAMERQKARAEKRWKDADIIRDKLNQEGYEVSDTKDGIKVKKI